MWAGSERGRNEVDTLQHRRCAERNISVSFGYTNEGNLSE